MGRIVIDILVQVIYRSNGNRLARQIVSAGNGEGNLLTSAFPGSIIFQTNPNKGCEEDKYTPEQRHRERGSLRTRPLTSVEWTSELQGERKSE
jgi:hypothetical protein